MLTLRCAGAPSILNVQHGGDGSDQSVSRNRGRKKRSTDAMVRILQMVRGRAIERKLAFLRSGYDVISDHPLAHDS